MGADLSDKGGGRRAGGRGRGERSRINVKIRLTNDLVDKKMQYDIQ